MATAVVAMPPVLTTGTVMLLVLTALPTGHGSPTVASTAHEYGVFAAGAGEVGAGVAAAAGSDQQTAVEALRWAHSLTSREPSLGWQLRTSR